MRLLKRIVRFVLENPALIVYALLAAILLAMLTHPNACLWHASC